MVVQGVDGGVPLGALSAGKVELSLVGVERGLDLLVDDEHMLLHLCLVGQNLLANFTNVSTVHLKVVGQT